MISKNLEETEKIAEEFVRRLQHTDHGVAQLVALAGDLGGGKTTFTKAIAKIIGITEDITSPTYVIQKTYPIDFSGYTQFVHIDAYRLNSGAELAALNWQETLADAKNLIFLEWPERVADVLPENRRTISFTFVSENEREIVME